MFRLDFLSRCQDSGNYDHITDTLLQIFYKKTVVPIISGMVDNLKRC